MEGSSSEEMIPRAPWLFSSHREGPQRQCFHSVWYDTHRHGSIPELVNKCIVGTGYGWLVLVDHATNHCCLWNPSLAEMIELPNLDNSFMYNACVLSKPPTDPDCCVLFISTRIIDYAFCRQAFCRVGSDNYIEQSLPLQAAIPFEGQMYGLMRFNLQLVTVHFDFIEEKLELRQILTEEGQPWRIPDPFPKPMVTDEGEVIEMWIERYYLIEYRSSGGSDSELLLVHELTEPFSSNLREEFRVFRVDLSRMECVDLQSIGIGQRAIFMSFYGCGYSCLNAGSIKGPRTEEEEESIYYTVKDSHRVNRYDLNTGGRASWKPCPDEGVSRAMTYWVEDQVFSSFQI